MIVEVQQVRDVLQIFNFPQVNLKTDIFTVTNVIDPGRVHGSVYGDISIRTLKIRDLAIVKLLSILFQSCITRYVSR